MNNEAKTAPATPAANRTEQKRRGRPPADNIPSRYFIGNFDKGKITLTKEVDKNEATVESFRSGKPFFKVQVFTGTMDTTNGELKIIDKPYEE